MAKKLNFKDFLAVDYAPGEPDQVKLNAKKRKKDIPTGNTNESVDLDEALTLQQRQKRSRMMKKYKTRMKLGRERAERKTADMSVIKRRARKAARAMLAAKLISSHSKKGDLSYSKKQEIEKRLDKMKSCIDRAAQKLVPKMRKKEQERKHRKSQQK